MQQILFDTRSPEESLLDNSQTRVDLLDRKLGQTEKSTLTWMAGAALCFGMPLYMATQYPSSFPRNLFNTASSVLGLLAASKATSECTRFQNLDRKVWEESQHLGYLKTRNKEAERGAYEMHLDGKLRAYKPSKEESSGGQAYQQVQQTQPEWIEEAIRIQAVFKGLNLPISVVAKEIVGQRIHYTIRTTPGLDFEDLLGTQKYKNRLLVQAGLEDAKIVPQAGRLLLDVKNPYAPPMLNIKMRETAQKEVEFAVEQPQGQPQAQNWHPQPQGIRPPTPPQQPKTYTPSDYFAGRVPGFEWMAQMINYPGVLVWGAQGSGKTTFAVALARAKAEFGHRLQVLDPHRIYGHWEGVDCVGQGMDYGAIDSAMASFINEVREDYGNLATQPDYQPSAKTIICEELTNYASRCNNTGEFFTMSLSDIRKCNKCVLYISHGRTLGTLGGAKGVAKTRDDSLLELKLEAKIDQVTGKPVPALQGELKLPGREATTVKIPNFGPVSNDFADLIRANEDPYEEWDEAYEDGVGKGNQPEEDLPASNIPPESPLALLIANLREWIKALPRKPSDAELAAKLLEMTGLRFSQDAINGMKGALGLG